MNFEEHIIACSWTKNINTSPIINDPVKFDKGN